MLKTQIAKHFSTVCFLPSLLGTLVMFEIPLILRLLALYKKGKKKN